LNNPGLQLWDEFGESPNKAFSLPEWQMEKVRIDPHSWTKLSGNLNLAPSFSQKDILSNAPHQEQGSFKVRAVLE